jgi:ribulose-5-phosphate 4-epimerase/fuculose-1-phosphate aldolase
MKIIPPREADARADLAAAFRWAARLDWHESIANHFSVAISEDRCIFLMNPNGRHFSRVRASELLLLDARDESSIEGPGAPDPTAWYLHAYLHRRLPHAQCILHTHMPHATALGCIKDFELLMLDQNACRFDGRVAYDRDYDGMALNAAEGERVAALLATDNKSVLMMANHGVLVVGTSIAAAFDDLYYLERAAKVQLLALATGLPLALIPETVAAKACTQWLTYPGDYSRQHFDALREILDEEEPDYRL